MNTKTFLKWLLPGAHNNYQPYALRKKALTFYITVLFGLKATVGFLLFAFPQTAYYSSLSQEGIVNLANQARAEVNLEPLTINAKLNQSALLKAKDMMDNQYFAHTSPSGVEPWYWFGKVGYAYTYAGENLALGFETDEGVHEAWMNSEGHRDNIINPNYKEIGIGIVYGTFEGRYTSIIVQHFGSTEYTEPQDIPAYPPASDEEESSTPPPDTTPPVPPQIVSPPSYLTTKNTELNITGTAEPNNTIYIYEGEKKLGETQSNENGGFSFSLATKLSEGEHTFRAIAKDEAQNWSAFSQNAVVIVDTKPPVINIEKSYIIPSYLDPLGTFDVIAYVSGEPYEVRAVSDGNEVILEKGESGMYQGTIKRTTSNVLVKARDKAGNIATSTLNYTEDISTALKPEPAPTPTPPPSPEPAPSPTPSPESKIKIYPKDNAWGTFLDTLNRTTNNLIILFIGCTLIILILNIIVHISRQHPKTIASVIFVLLLSGLVLII